MPSSASLTTLNAVVIISFFTAEGISTSIFEFVYFSNIYSSVVGNIFCIIITSYRGFLGKCFTKFQKIF